MSVPVKVMCLTETLATKIHVKVDDFEAISDDVIFEQGSDFEKEIPTYYENTA